METVHRNTFRTRILIADDHAIFADALRIYLLEKTFTVIGAVGDGRALLREAVRLRPDVIIVDFAMPLLNGLDAARRIRELGRVAFVLKRSGGQELVKAIEETLHGRSYLTPKLRAQDWVAAKARARQFSKELTKRQRDFVQLFAEGRPMKEIAAVLNLSEKTVEFHKHHIMVTFNLKSNADLVLFALKHGLIAVDPEPHQRVLAS
jgi:DNA-binding NarL/FixJ family response regulator